MKNLALLRNHVSCKQLFLMLSGNVEVGMWTKPVQIEYNNILEVLTVVHFLLTLVS